MKTFLSLCICLLILSNAFLFGTTRTNNASEKFSTKSDTLIIQTGKLKGNGLFEGGAGEPAFRDTNEWKGLDWFKLYPDYKVIYPDVKQLKLGFLTIMFDSLRYFDKVTGKKEFQQNLSVKDKCILMVKGILNDIEVLIVDENHNFDLRDDSIRKIKKWDWDMNKNLIMCKYIINKGGVLVNDSGWFRIGQVRGNLLNSKAQHFYARFSVRKAEYAVGVCDENSTSFCTYNPVLYVSSENGKNIDTLIKSNMVHLGGYLKLGKTYYKFQDFYNGSGTIVLVKEKNFSELTGTQVGMKFPDFRCVSDNGDTLRGSELIKDKPLLIANVSGCTRRSYDVFKSINEACRKQLSIIGLESKVDTDLGGIMIDVEKDFNKDMYAKYRNAYSSYDCYLVDKKGRVLDMFDLFSWEHNLAKYKY